MTEALDELYGALPLWTQILYWTVLAIVLSSVVQIVVFFITAYRFQRRVRREHQRRTHGDAEAEFLWIFLVPALNEEVTIADSLSRLAETSATNAVFLVINDGSDDATGEILAGIKEPRLRVLTRTAPNARIGKALALNDAYGYIRETVLKEPVYAGWDEKHVIVVVVDADGRLSPAAPDSAARHFADPGVGGLQVLVRIYNRRGLLTWAQDVEFSAFGRVFQAARAWWGTANLGGNGQFTRLSALAAIDEGHGPWRDRLTEDQDLGVRMIQAGWANVQDNEAVIEQQGLNSLRRLYRQRVRWAQGNWQSFSLLAGVGKPRLPFFARVDAVYYLITPLLQLLTGIAFVTSIVMWILDVVPHPLTRWWVIVIFLSLSYGPAIATLILRGTRWYSPLLAIVLAIPYTIYSWMIFPVLATSLIRQLMGRKSWAKTARESLEPVTEAVV